MDRMKGPQPRRPDPSDLLEAGAAQRFAEKAEERLWNSDPTTALVYAALSNAAANARVGRMLEKILDDGLRVNQKDYRP
jgi:hypothetical protein